jgi:hypothetical protein
MGQSLEIVTDPLFCGAAKLMPLFCDTAKLMSMIRTLSPKRNDNRNVPAQRIGLAVKENHQTLITTLS